MFHELIVLLPCTAALMMTVFLIMRKGKTPSETFMMIITMVASLHFFADANMVTAAAGDNMLVHSDMIRMFTDPLLFPLFCIYFRTLTRKNPFKNWMYISLAPSIILFSGVSVLYIVAGLQNSADYLRHLEYGVYNEMYDQKLYRTITYFDKYGYRIAVAGYCALAILYIFHLNHYVRGSSRSILRHYFKREKLSIVRIQTLNVTCLFILTAIRLCFDRSYLVSHHYVSDILSILLTVELVKMFAVGLIRGKHKITVKEMFSAFMKPTKKKIIRPDGFKKKITPEFLKDDRVADAFYKFMEEQEGFRIKGITIGMVAEELKTNRSYISQLLNNTFETTFPEYLNNLRIRYAKDYISEHPNERQEVVANICGFDSVSSFSRKFREYEGITAGMWAEQCKRRF